MDENIPFQLPAHPTRAALFLLHWVHVAGVAGEGSNNICKIASFFDATSRTQKVILIQLNVSLLELLSHTIDKMTKRQNR